jgi:hypothetical protein
MKRWAFLLFTFFLVTAAVAQPAAKANRQPRPRTLEEAVQRLQHLHSDSLQQRIVAQTEEEFIGHTHLELGMWMRNQWGLWRGGPLIKHFNSLGISHPDDMSGLILRCYYRALRQQDWQVAEQVQRSQAYWLAAQAQQNRWQNDPAYRARMQAQLDSTERAFTNVELAHKKATLVPGTRVRAYLSYQCGLLPLGERTLLEGTVVRWVGDAIELQITHYVDAGKQGRVIRCNGVTNDTVRVHWRHNYVHAPPTPGKE